MEAVEARRLLAWAGPDGYGYEANEYPYEALDLMPGDGGVNSVLDGDDDGFATVSLGANSFRFYGTAYNNLIVSVNGLITFGSSSAYFANSNLSSTPTERAIAPLWDDWRTDQDTVVSGPLNDVVLYKIDTPNNRLIVEWNAVRNISTGSAQMATFQAILQLNTGANDGSMTFNYPDLDLGNATINNGGAATVGIKDAGPQGANVVLVSFNSNGHPLVQSGAALRITKGPPTSTGSIAGKAFHDWNLDGLMNGSENAVSGATVYLDLNLNGVKDGTEPSAVTDGAGNYSITGLVDGSYTVREIAPAGLQPVGALSASVSAGGATTGVNPANYRTIYAGTSGNDPYTLRKNGAGQFEVVQSGGGTFLVPASSTSTLEFDLAGGDDPLTVDYVNGNPVPNGGVLFDGGGNATSAGDKLIVSGSSLADTIDLYGNAGGAVASTIATNAEATAVNAGGGNDVLTVNSGLGSAVAFDDGAGVDTLNYYGTNGNDTIGITLVFNIPSISGGGNSVSFVQLPEQIMVDALAGDDTINLNSNLATTSLTVRGGSGNDVIHVGGPGNSSDVDGNVSVSGGGGIDVLEWSDLQVNTAGLGYTVTSTSITRAGAGVVTLSQISNIVVALGNGADKTVSIESTPSGRTITVQGGTGADYLVLGPNLDNLAGAVVFTDVTAGDVDKIYVEDDTTAFNSNYTLTATSVARGLFGGLTFSGAERLELQCQNGNNIVTMNAGGTFPATTVSGNGGTDALIMTGSAAADTWFLTFGNVMTALSTVTYFGLESITLNLGSGNDSVMVNSTNATVPVTISGDDGNDTLTISGAPSSGVLYKGGLLASDQDTLNVNAGTYTFQSDARLTSANLKLSVGSAGNVVFNSTQHLAGLVVSGKASMGADGNRYLDTKGLAIGASGKLDLNDNDIVVEYSSGPFVAYDQVWAWIVSGYSSEVDSTKVGILSTSGQQAGGLTVLEIIDNAMTEAPEWPAGSGNAIPVHAIIGKYTYFGDSDWDGQVTPQDYTAIDANLGATQDRRIAMLSGDLDFDNVVTPQDYTVVDASLGVGVGNPLSLPAKQALELGDRPREDLE
jgi:hypothetical protein